MKCCDCCNLKEDDKKCGRLCGAKYYCKKIDDYVDGSCACCDKFDKSYRSNYMRDEIYKDGYNYSDDDRPIAYHLAMLALVIIVGTFLSLFQNGSIF